MSKLHTVWTKHIKDAEQKSKMEASVLSSHVALNRLREILEETLESLQKPKESDYESPAWGYLQAHRNGRIQEINTLLTLLEPIKR